VKPPAWAVRLVSETCEARGIKAPTLTWRKGSGLSSSGRYYATEDRITITAGSDRQDQRLVLLHEIAHHLTPKAHHGEAFWRVAWALFREHRLTRYALTRKTPYKAAAGRVAIAMRIPGARAAAKSATATRQRRTQPRGVCPMPADEAAAQGYSTPHTHYVGTFHRHNRPDGSYADYWTPGRDA
jgi:hypothetical protein